MKMLNKLALFVMVLLLSVVSIPATQLSAATAPVGTEQKIKKIYTTSELFDFYYATEKGQEFLVYCFNYDLHWPKYSNEEIPGYEKIDGIFSDGTYVPDDFNHISDEVKDKLYRIFYAGYPHNNAGLYIPQESGLPTDAMIREALELDAGLKTELPELKSLTLTYFGDGSGSIDKKGTPTAEKFFELCQKMIAMETKGTDEEKDAVQNIKINYPKFYAIAVAYQKAYINDDIANLNKYYKEALPSTNLYLSEADAHDQTQLAIWYLLCNEGIADNESFIYFYYPGFIFDDLTLSDKLVEFAYGSDPVPSRENAFDKMEDYKNSFNNKEHLLNSSNVDVGTAGGIKFTKNPFDGLYYSEKLHFTNDDGHETYQSPFEISVMNGTEELSKIVTHGKDEIVLVSEKLPTGATVKIQSENYWPSPIYQYVAKSDKTNGTRAYQEMSGVYFEKVDLGFEVNAYAESGNLTVKKQVSNTRAAEGTDFWFDANIKVLDGYGNQQSGDLNFAKYNLNSDGTIDESTKIEGKVHNFGKTEGEGNNTKFSLKANQAIVFPGLPYGTEYSITEYALSETGDDTGNWKPSYVTNGVIDKNSGTLSKDSNNTVVVTNTYAYTQIPLKITGAKTLSGYTGEGDGFGKDDFKFVLWPDVHGYPMPEGSTFNSRTGFMEKVASNSAPSGGVAEIDFGTINFDAEGKYRYTIEEQQVTKENISKDLYHYDVFVEVVDNSGKLERTTTVTKHDSDHKKIGDEVVVANDKDVQVSFVNTYNIAEIDKEIRIKKSINNTTSNNNMDKNGYKFNIVPNTTDESTYPKFKGKDSTSVVVETGISGEAISPVLEFKSDDWFTSGVNGTIEFDYYINEIEPDEANKVKGIEYDNQVAEAKIIVTKIAEAKYTAEIKYSYKDAAGDTQTDVSTPIVFTNVYSAKGGLELNISKQITSAITYTPTNGEFYEVKIDDDFERNKDENGNKTGYKLPNENPKLTYDKTTSKFILTNNTIEFTKEGDYRFELSEVVPASPLLGMKYDTNKWIVDVNVKDKGDGTLDITSEYYSEKEAMVKRDEATFVNEYKAEVTVPVKLSKELIGRHLNTTDNFSVVIEHYEVEGIEQLNSADVCASHTNISHSMMESLNSTNNFELDIADVANIYKAGTYFLTFKEEVPSSTTMSYDPSIYVMKIVVEQPTSTSTNTNTLKITDGYPEYYKAVDASSLATAEKVSSDNFVFTNKVTNLTIKKEANGMNPDLIYGFNIAFTDSENSPIAYKMLPANIEGTYIVVSTDSSGKVYIELMKDQAAEITDLPNGTKYTIEEVASPSCDTEITISEDGTETSKKTGKTISDELVAGVKEEVLVVNTAKKPDDKPEYPKVVDTGDNSRTGAYIALAGLSAIGVALVSLTINKLEKN